eukprot:TRINITY_DN24887_c0_g1_i1.p1 TRINITY_DN24887_c0_g1~~TRINITY_DN24887_c0_g1_i1.p1  ORF type:complete len:641 (+),score=235.53 TRINITY_DN24887_c0_g1_i1:59-1981(+)
MATGEVAPAGIAMSPQLDLMQTQEIMCELQDELKIMETRVEERDLQIDALLEKNRKRERALLDCLEGLVGYTTMVEQNVIQPALGDLLAEVQRTHGGVAAVRNEAVNRITRVVGPAAKQGRLSTLLKHLREPSAMTLASEERRKAILNWEGNDGLAGRVYEPEDAYVLGAALLEDKEHMQQILRFCMQTLEQGGEERTRDNSASPGAMVLGAAADGAVPVKTAKVLERQAKELSMLQQQNDSLKAEVQRLHILSLHAPQNTGVESDANQSVNQGATAVAGRVTTTDFGSAMQVEGLEATIRQERKILNQKIESLQNALNQVSTERDALLARAEEAERAAARADRERHVLQQQSVNLDGLVQTLQQEQSIANRKLEQADTKGLLLEQERAIVRQKFETVGQALTDGELEKQALRKEIEDLKERMAGGATQYDTLRAALTRERDEGRRLRAEVDVLQREVTSTRDVYGHAGNRDNREELIAAHTEILRLKNELMRVMDTQQSMLDLSKSREDELAAKCRKLTEVSDRLKKELEHAVVGRAPLDAQSAGPDAMHSRISQFEASMNRLNSELGTVEGRIQSLTPSTATDTAQLQKKLERERAAYEAERTECDHIVRQMTEELEYLVAENQRLKSQQQLLNSSVA